MNKRLALLLSALLALTGLTPARRVPPIPERLTVPPSRGYVSVDGVRIFYAEYETGGVPIILLEGGGDTIDDWGFLVPVLEPRYRVIVLDTRCQGRSTCSPEPLSYQRNMLDVVAVLDHLDIRKAVFCGFSDGAIVALELAIQHPERVIGVFAHGANTSPAALISNMSPADATVGRALDRVLRGWYAAESPTPNGYDALGRRLDVLWRTQPHLTAAQLHSIRVPVWISDGDHEEGIRRSDTDFMAREIPTASEIIFPDSGHYALWSQHELFDESVQRFLQTLSP